MKLHKIRKEQNVTQVDLANMCETTQQQIAKIESGLVDPKLSTLRKLAEALKVEVGELFYTKAEFVDELNNLIKEEGLTSKHFALATLNRLAFELKKIPKYHPFWEKIKISKNRIIFMEENDV